jgi:glucose/arabinose dehydrogenase
MIRQMLVLAMLAGCGRGGPDAPQPPTTATGIRLAEVARGFDQPLYVTAPAGDSRLFVVEQTGHIRIVKNGQPLAAPFIDLSAKISSGGERGLLSIAFHPRYATNGFFYVDYTDRNGDTRVERYHVSSNPDVADPASGQLVLFQQQPYANHNGGLLLFGPDGDLYVGFGDGGSGGDPLGNGQNPGTLLGKILRIDVDHAQPYSVPADNPFVGQAGKRPEIWITGVRNPWRFSFDRAANLLYVADVGQSAYEEVDVVPAGQGGLNFGWNVMEGMHCYNAGGCVQQGLTLPVLEYTHDDGSCSITGGYVYRGRAIPSLAGTYFYSDYCKGWLRSFRWDGAHATEQKSWDVGGIGNVTSFGEDASRELYLTTSGGVVYRIEPGA